MQKLHGESIDSSRSLVDLMIGGCNLAIGLKRSRMSVQANTALVSTSRRVNYRAMLESRLNFNVLNEIYVMRCCFLRFFYHGYMAAFFDDYSFMIL